MTKAPIHNDEEFVQSTNPIDVYYLVLLFEDLLEL